MPSFAISKFTVLLEPLWVSAEFLLLSTDPLLYIIAAAAAVLYSCRPLLQLYTVFQLCACHPLTSNMTVTERFATSRYYCLMPVHARGGLTLTLGLTLTHAQLGLTLTTQV